MVRPNDVQHLRVNRESYLILYLWSATDYHRCYWQYVYIMIYVIHKDDMYIASKVIQQY